MDRVDGRNFDELRRVRITRNYLKHPQGSVLMEIGKTKIICTAMIEDRVPPFLKGAGSGWLTGEYSMLPGSTKHRKIRDSSRGRIEGRTQEIQRLIGRSLRGIIDLSHIGERTIWIDCDVIQADGGTRTASITGGFIALVDALNHLYNRGEIEYIPVSKFASAISAGIVDGVALLDLCYSEDYRATVDMNIVMADDDQLIEIQGTGEGSTFTQGQLYQLLELAEKGNRELILKQREALGDIADLIGKNMEGHGDHDEA
ncbi:MAG: ribonuclease PH [Tissierellia bacterium]|nr:ribonuclease PH [Tissierellia bacterium]